MSQLEEMKDSSAAFYCGIRDNIEEQGRGKICPEARLGCFVSLQAWYLVDKAFLEFMGLCPYELYRGVN